MLFYRQRNAIMQHELKEAANDMRGVTGECLTTAVSNSVGPIMASGPCAMPSKATIRFVSTYLMMIQYYNIVVLVFWIECLNVCYFVYVIVIF